MKKIIIGVILIGLGVLIGFPVFSIADYTMARTSIPQFCASCHEIQPADNERRDCVTGHLKYDAYVCVHEALQLRHPVNACVPGERI